MISMKEAKQQIKETPGLFLSPIAPPQPRSPRSVEEKNAAENGATHRLMWASGNWRIGDKFQAFVRP